MKLIDSHCHLDFDALASESEQLLPAARQLGIEAIVMPGVSPEQWPAMRALQAERQRQLQDNWPQLAYALGLHPWWVDEYLAPHPNIDSALDQLESDWHKAHRDSSAVAVGECGLDGVIDTDLSVQQAFLERHIAWAKAQGLPLILHVRKAHNELLTQLQRHFDAMPSSETPVRGVIHGFSGSEQLARQYWRLGFYLGVGGTITYERAAKTRRALAAMPLQALLLETDAPDMPLQGFQGQPNRPQQVVRVASVLAELQGVSVAEVAEQTTANSRRLFSL